LKTLVGKNEALAYAEKENGQEQTNSERRCYYKPK
tara:strand:- start:1403 stop:1507 length:105 start_codon:yes stop_codon:yes gene_type:complete